jgi:hypothetical protein
MHAQVEALLATVPRTLRRVEVARTRPGLLYMMRDWSTQWAACCEELGFPCPAPLLELASAMKDVYIHCHDEHGWDLLTPDDAHERRSFLARLADKHPELAPRAAMLPVFGQSGNLMLLDKGGQAHRFTVGDWQHDTLVLRDFDALLRFLVTGAIDKNDAATDVL